jgi:simple sugar transport system ATP-binding protein
LRLKALRITAKKKILDMGIICQSELEQIETLSGGNQQKVIVGRWLLKPCKLLILDEPFQGVDIKARQDIGTYIRQTANKRATVVFVSELDEALEIADRILVMSEKSVVGEHKNQNVNLDKILMEISGQAPVGMKNWNTHAV